ncbi:MAG: alpha/beta fold hydrolase [Acidimicrobiia bacterium]
MTKVEGRTGALDWSEVGTGPARPLVMIHALGADRGLFAPQLPVLSATRRVIQFDLPGHGASSAVPGPYAIGDLGLDVLDIATAAGADEFDLCGISLGGLMGLWVATNASDRVGALVVSNTAARVGTEELWAARIEAVESGGMDSIREMALTRFFTPGLAATDPSTVERTGLVLAATDPVGYAGCCAALRDADLRESVGAIRNPTLVVGADQDVSTPPADSRWLHENITGSELRMLDGAAHLSNLEQPEAWTSAVAGFLSR